MSESAKWLCFLKPKGRTPRGNLVLCAPLMLLECTSADVHLAVMHSYTLPSNDMVSCRNIAFQDDWL